MKTYDHHEDNTSYYYFQIFFWKKFGELLRDLDRTFVSSVFLVIVCVAPLILKRGFHFGNTLVGDTRALRGCGFFGASVLPYRVGCFFCLC